MKGTYKKVMVFEGRLRNGEIYITDDRDALPCDIVRFNKHVLIGSKLEVFCRVRQWALESTAPYVSITLGDYECEIERSSNE